ncbi:MAG: septal ring lytic transglycosylase RlpA family protein [Patescibacteria group bacterium]|nr:septal ring lytic transglycosylase RlpA family protein [Patescibacteria group bacterium]
MLTYYKKIVISLLIIIGLVINFNCVQAKAVLTRKVVYLGQEILDKGFTLESYDQNFKIGVWPKILNQPSKLSLNDEGRAGLVIPDDKSLISNLYVYKFNQTDFADFQGAYTLKIKYTSDNVLRKGIYFYNPAMQTWSEAQPSKINLEDQTMSINLKFPYAQVAVLEDKVEQGQASWYHCVGGLYAAHPEYERGTYLKVTNLENDKSVVVKVNDWGPDRSIFPERVIDLDSQAFKQLAPLSWGVINVKVEKIDQLELNE